MGTAVLQVYMLTFSIMALVVVEDELVAQTSCLSVCQGICQGLCLGICLVLVRHLSGCLSAHLSEYLSEHLSGYMSASVRASLGVPLVEMSGVCRDIPWCICQGICHLSVE